MNANLFRQITDKTLTVGGATYDIVHGREIEPIDAWFYPAYPGLTVIVPAHELPDALQGFMAQHRAILNEKHHYLGTWINPQTGLVYIDITTFRHTKHEALTEADRLSKQQGRQIESIFNPRYLKTIKTSTTTNE